MISNEEKEGWNYISVKKALLLYLYYSKHDGDFYYLNRPNSFRTEIKLISHHKVC